MNSLLAKPKIIFFGKNKISKKCFSYLSRYYKSKFNIVFYKKNLNLDNWLIGFSIKYTKKIPRNLINKFKYGVVNFHNGNLPMFAGLYSIHHTIRLRSKLKIKDFSITAHYIDEKFDNGPIIKKYKFKLSKNENAFSLYKKSTRYIYIFFKKLSKSLLKKKLPSYKSNKKTNYFDKMSLNNQINLKQNYKFTKDQIDSLFFPGKEPPFVIVSNKKYLLKYVK